MLCSQDKEIVADKVHKYSLLYGKRKNPTMKEML